MYDSSLLPGMISSGSFDSEFARLYPNTQTADCRKRYENAVLCFNKLFGNRSVIMVSAPGRTEIIGNHTDHQNGRVLAAAVDLDIICIASANENNAVRIKSEGYKQFELDLTDLSQRQEEAGPSAALVRGVAAWFDNNGFPVKGFDAYATSNVLSGSGLSSSAAFEVAVGNIFASLSDVMVTPVDIAKAGQYAENCYLGKPSGLMDQTASSVGALVSIDFNDPQRPVVESVPFDLKEYSLHLCIVDTKGSHANLNAEYASIPEEMCAVAAQFGKKRLREVDEAEFFGSLKSVRSAVGDRALLRALHFFEENKRVSGSVDAAQNGDIGAFLSYINLSGKSSLALLQNISTTKDSARQEIAVALALSEYELKGQGATRVHGGGFAGTIQAFVPDALLYEYKSRMADLFGSDAIYTLNIRPIGGYIYGRN